MHGKIYKKDMVADLMLVHGCLPLLHTSYRLNNQVIQQMVLPG